MIAPNVAAARVIDFERERLPRFQRAFLELAEMHDEVARLLLRVGDAKARALAR